MDFHRVRRTSKAPGDFRIRRGAQQFHFFRLPNIGGRVMDATAGNTQFTTALANV